MGRVFDYESRAPMLRDGESESALGCSREQSRSFLVKRRGGTTAAGGGVDRGSAGGLASAAKRRKSRRVSVTDGKHRDFAAVFDVTGSELAELFTTAVAVIYSSLRGR